MTQPFIIVVSGLRYSGCTTLLNGLSKQLSLPVLKTPQKPEVSAFLVAYQDISESNCSHWADLHFHLTARDEVRTDRLGRLLVSKGKFDLFESAAAALVHEREVPMPALTKNPVDMDTLDTSDRTPEAVKNYFHGRVLAKYAELQGATL